MTEDPGLEPILAYLREHSARYSYSALRDQLLQSGYGPAEVDRALAIYQQENPPTPPVQVWPKALQVAAVNVVLALLAIPVMSSARGQAVSLIGIAYSVIFWGELLGGIVLAVRRQSRVWGLALVFGFLLSTGLGLLVLGGICLFFLSQGNSWN
jgi:hypothetical protein